MFAIIEESGSQRKVAKGDLMDMALVNSGEAKPGDKVTFDKVLVVGEAGGGAKIGLPYVSGASVTVEVVEPVVFGDKVEIWKFREKKAWRRHTGHRQRYTRVKVTAING